MDTKLKSRYIAITMFAVSVYMLGIALLSALDFIEKKEFLKKDYYFTSSAFHHQIDVRLTNNYENLLKSFSIRTKSIKYYIQDKKTNEVYSNLGFKPDEQFLRDKAIYTLTFPHEPYPDTDFQTINTYFQKNQLDGYIIIPKEVDSYSQIHADYTYYLSIRERIIKEGILFVVSLLAGISLLVYLRSNQSFTLGFMEKYTSLINRVPLDVRIITFIVVSFMTFIHVTEASFFYMPLGLSHIFILTILSIFIAYLLLGVKEGITLLQNKTELRNQWRQSYCLTLLTLIKDSLVTKSIFLKVVLVVALTVLLGMFWLPALLHPSEEAVLLLAFYTLFYLLFVVPFILKKIVSLNKILKGAEEIAAGNLNFVIEENDKGNLSNLAHNINNMKLGFKKSLENQMKSERLKSELITNVSHDLKTPLTSIINYVNLLKREGLSPEEASHYVEILDRKTQRLKVLIDDLFEASKMASGTVELHIEKVDVAALLNQALAEFDDKIEDSPLTFRVNIENKNIYADLDGKKTWRVFENLLSNALKYSQPHTRVYIHLTDHEDKVVLTVQNISAYEIDFDVEEIFERFKRGDKSRNTEGSGLGLAIAKSIIELQGGEFKIEIEGDSFKAIVEFYRR